MQLLAPTAIKRVAFGEWPAISPHFKCLVKTRFAIMTQIWIYERKTKQMGKCIFIKAFKRKKQKSLE